MNILTLITNKFVIAGLILAYGFFNFVWVPGVFLTKTTPVAESKSPLAGLTLIDPVELDGFNLFGEAQEQDPQAEQNESNEDIFNNADREYIGRLNNMEFILYATAKVGEEITAKLLIRNKDDEAVSLVTIKQEQVVKGVRVDGIALSKVQLSSQGESLTLKLLKKRSPVVNNQNKSE